MPPRSQTRDRLLHTAADLFRKQGYSATGLAQVVQESGSPKGVLYFHFPEGKDQLAAESVKLSGAELGTRMAAAIRRSPDVPSAISALGNLFAADLLESGFRDGCPVATVALDAADQSELIRAACQSVYESWLDGLAGYLRGQAIAEAEARELASLIFTSLQGALLLARLQHDVGVIHAVTQMVGAVAGDTASRSAHSSHPDSP